MQDHWRVDPLSVARSCAHAVEAKGSEGHYLREALLHRIGAMQDPIYQFRRTPLPHTRGNKGKKSKGRTQSSSRALQDAG
jgi:hypothetical protein